MGCILDFGSKCIHAGFSPWQLVQKFPETYDILKNVLRLTWHVQITKGNFAFEKSATDRCFSLIYLQV